MGAASEMVTGVPYRESRDGDPTWTDGGWFHGPRWQKENEHIRVLKTGCWGARVLGWGVHL